MSTLSYSDLSVVHIADDIVEIWRPIAKSVSVNNIQKIKIFAFSFLLFITSFTVSITFLRHPFGFY